MDVLKWSLKKQISYFPGVLTPTEIMMAQAEGLEMLKIFPISSMGGAKYLESLRGPFPNLKWMPTGGVSLQNIGEYFKAGAHCVGIGGQLIPQKMIQDKDWASVRKFTDSILQQVQLEKKSWKK